ncbi:CopD family protein [Maritimibacter sp. HL-12]|uniref:CopD family protein n=1 Tax=Maritimibacter sp. HL-12 TaxID=1162418 RepID=UPI000A0F2F13|nr:CopD family protein [Maritimibacter sp. HL-12]SMH50207.1 Copper resistance protein D [Maritimibacter sp. HL-12]
MFYTILALHLLGAAIWTGGHLVLAFTVLPRALRAGDPRVLTDFEAGYERIGIPALLVQVATGLWLALYLVPDWRDWFSAADPVGAAVGVKLALLAATAALALNARFRVIPRLSAETLPLMGWHIRGVTLFSVLFVLAGAFIRTGGL